MGWVMVKTMPRLFFALTFPGSVRREIHTLHVQPYVGELKQSQWKMVPTENYHLTLHFLGEISPRATTRLVDDFFHTPFPKAQTFSIGGKPPQFFGKNVCYVPVRDARNFLTRLHEKCAELYHPPEERDFTPHITIARRSHGKTAPPLLSTSHEHPTFFAPQHVSLLVSQTQKGKTTYPEIARMPLSE